MFHLLCCDLTIFYNTIFILLNFLFITQCSVPVLSLYQEGRRQCESFVAGRTGQHLDWHSLTSPWTKCELRCVQLLNITEVDAKQMSYHFIHHWCYLTETETKCYFIYFVTQHVTCSQSLQCYNQTQWGHFDGCQVHDRLLRTDQDQDLAPVRCPYSWWHLRQLPG